MADKKKAEEVVYEGEFSARVNPQGDMTENILRNVKGAESLVLHSGRTSKFKSDRKYRMVITEIAEEPVPETEVDKSTADKEPTA